jgi:hypothetical protein
MGVLIAAAQPAVGWFRGDEYEQRDFEVDAEYFVDLLPILPRIEERLAWWNATNAYVGGAGSYTRRDLFNLQNLKLEVPLAPPVGFQFEFMANQDYDGIYQHYLLGLDCAVNEAWTVALVGEPLARKEYADVGAAVRRKAGRSRLNIMALLPDFSFNRKNDMGGTIETKPVNFQLDMLQEVSENVDLFVRTDMDFPSKIRFMNEEFVFEYESWKPGAGLIWHKGTDEILWGEIATEDTEKERASFSGTAPEDFRTARRVRQGRVEYVRYPAGRNRCSVGAQYVHISENNSYPNKLDTTGLLHELAHTTRMIYGTMRRPVGNSFYAETGLILDYVFHTETQPLDAERKKSDSSGLEGKVPFSIGWQGRHYRFDAGISVQVDDVAFGGGYATGMILF